MKQIFLGIILAFSLLAGAKSITAFGANNMIATAGAKDVIKVTNKAGGPADPLMFLGVVSADPDLSDWFIDWTEEKSSIILQGITELKVSPPKLSGLNQSECEIKEVNNEFGIGLFRGQKKATRCIQQQRLVEIKPIPLSDPICFTFCHGSNETYYPAPTPTVVCERISSACIRCCYDEPICIWCG